MRLGTVPDIPKSRPVVNNNYFIIHTSMCNENIRFLEFCDRVNSK